MIFRSEYIFKKAWFNGSTCFTQLLLLRFFLSSVNAMVAHVTGWHSDLISNLGEQVLTLRGWRLCRSQDRHYRDSEGPSWAVPGSLCDLQSHWGLANRNGHPETLASASRWGQHFLTYIYSQENSYFPLPLLRWRNWGLNRWTDLPNSKEVAGQ